LQPHDLIATATHLASRATKKPLQSDLKRAESTTYYALFHTLAKNCADSMMGAVKKGRPNKAWQQVYRALDHGIAKNACKNGDMAKFPQSIQDFANIFVAMQVKRHNADYDPFYRVTKSKVLVDIENARAVIKQFHKVPMKDKKAFSAWVLFKNRPQ
jgi:uncharacterized protein (UPF0332 family)